MSDDEQVCIPLTDESGEVVALARVSLHLSEEGRRHLLALVEAARGCMAEQDAADPEGAAERQRRYERGQQRIRELNRRLGGAE